MTESSNIYQFIKSLAEREGVSEDRIKEIIVESFRRSYCKEENARADLSFEFNAGLSAYRIYQIVEQVNDPEKEITNDDKLLKKGKVKDNKLFLSLDIKNFSISLSNEIRKQLLGDLGEIGQGRQFKIFKTLQGQVVKGVIQGVQENYYLVRLEKGFGYWEKKEWTLPEAPRLGQRFFFLIKEVKEKVEKNMPQIILTRHDNLFIHRLLEQEIPQIKESIVAIRHILRLPGLVSKVVVEKGKVAVEKGLDIDPAGTCIGEKGERIKSVSRLTYPERIEIVGWSENQKQLLGNFLSPAKVIELIEKENDWEVTILQEKASLVLEHRGKLLKEIASYLGKNIHVRGLEEIKKEKNTIIVWNGKLDEREVEILCKKINN